MEPVTSAPEGLFGEKALASERCVRGWASDPSMPKPSTTEAAPPGLCWLTDFPASADRRPHQTGCRRHTRPYGRPRRACRSQRPGRDISWSASRGILIPSVGCGPDIPLCPDRQVPGWRPDRRLGPEAVPAQVGRRNLPTSAYGPLPIRTIPRCWRCVRASCGLAPPALRSRSGRSVGVTVRSFTRNHVGPN